MNNISIKWVMILALILPSLAGAGDTKFLLIDGGIEKDSNYKRYYNSILVGYENASALDKDVKVLAKDGAWKLSNKKNPDGTPINSFCKGCARTGDGIQKVPGDENAVPTYPPVSGSAKSVEDIAEAIKAMNLKSGDSLIMQLTSHGGTESADNTLTPEETTYCLWGKCVPFKDLEKALKAAPAGVKIKMMTTSCFGGGIQKIARDLPNVCAVSSVPFFTQSTSKNVSLFTQGFYDKLGSTPHPGKKTVSFGEAALNALEKDSDNNPKGNISSFDFVNHVLKKGPYDVNDKYRADFNPDSKLPDISDQITFDQKATVFDWTVPNSYNAKQLNAVPNVGSCFNDKFYGSFKQDEKRITNLDSMLKQMTADALEYERKQNAAAQPDWLKSVFHQAMAEIKKELPVAKAYEAKFAELKRKSAAHELKYKNYDGWDIWNEEESGRADLQAEFDALKKQMAADDRIKKYDYHNHILDQLDKLGEFNKAATPAQKDKFMQLLQCEMEPI